MVQPDPHDKRSYFQRIVDDIRDQITDGTLPANSPLPSARQMARHYGVASMTAQRALRELQHLRLTYGVPGKGTFVHPDTVTQLRNGQDGLREPGGGSDSDLFRRVADYLATQSDLLRQYRAARTTSTREKILAELVTHAEQHKDIFDDLAPYQTTTAGRPRRSTTTRRTNDAG